ncbi:MAG: TP0733 family outer membrane beta-barrel protein [Sphaerochaetaceae bacterium]
MKKTITALVLIALIAVMSASAAEAYSYETGDQAFSFKAGLTIPAFIWFPNDSTDSGFVSGSETHMKLGGIGSLSYMYFVSPKIAIGGTLGYSFNYSRSAELVTEVPIMAKASWYPVQTGRFDLIASLSLGIAFTRYSGGFYTSPAAEIEIEPVFYFNDNWGIGISSGLLWVSEIYWKEKKEDTSIAALAPIKLTCHYRH